MSKQLRNLKRRQSYLTYIFTHKLDDRYKDVPALSEPNNTVDSIHSEVEEVQNILKSLQAGKASGPDFMNNR